MNKYVTKVVSFILILSLFTFGWSGSAAENHHLKKGKESAEVAARFGNSQQTPSPSLRNVTTFTTQPDSTEEVVFDEEEDRNLVKEITVWVIGAAFVGYFIVKVFLEGDEEESEPEKPKKDIPGVFNSNPLFSF